MACITYKDKLITLKHNKHLKSIVYTENNEEEK